MDFKIAEVLCDKHNLIEFQMLGKVLKRQEKDIDKQIVSIGRDVYNEKYGQYLVSVRQAHDIGMTRIENELDK